MYSLAVLLRIYFRNLWACWNPHAARGTNDHGTGTASHLALGAVFTFLDVGEYMVLTCRCFLGMCASIAKWFMLGKKDHFIGMCTSIFCSVVEPNIDLIEVAIIFDVWNNIERPVVYKF